MLVHGLNDPTNWHRPSLWGEDTELSLPFWACKHITAQASFDTQPLGRGAVSHSSASEFIVTNYSTPFHFIRYWNCVRTGVFFSWYLCCISLFWLASLISDGSQIVFFVFFLPLFPLPSPSHFDASMLVLFSILLLPIHGSSVWRGLPVLTVCYAWLL